MLQKRTVFVLGAGASKPFNFPTGAELRDQVIGSLQHDGAQFRQLIELGHFSERRIVEFRNALQRSGASSVDAFLEHRTEFTAIGKAAMGALLILHEHIEALYQGSNNWLLYLFNRLSPRSLSDFEDEKLAFITFNYDRSVEAFFHTSLQNRFNKNDMEVAEAMRAIPIVHLHGRLGYLPWESEGMSAGQARPYTSEVNEFTLRISMLGIKIIHEVSDNEDFTGAKVLLARADQILFAGFGYNATNVQRLGIPDLPSDRSWGTAVGLGQREKNDANALCGNKVTLLDRDCFTLVRENVDWY